MQDKVPVRVKDIDTGQFTKKPPEQILVRKQVFLDREQIEEIEKQIGKRQGFSGFVRDAIAFYLQHGKAFLKSEKGES